MISVGCSIKNLAVKLDEFGANINGQYCRDMLLTQELLPVMQIYWRHVVFWQNNAPAYCDCETVKLLCHETTQFISSDIQPAKISKYCRSPDLGHDAAVDLCIKNQSGMRTSCGSGLLRAEIYLNSSRAWWMMRFIGGEN